ncbi:hypothetical protein R1flu_013271 [Riccia fluitans]|uniref:Uncharacterized protein n=1 Tax=Riccia fluitans TaxID=41844 RepID=A0ABD1YDJ0_9MARC
MAGAATRRVTTSAVQGRDCGEGSIHGIRTAGICPHTRRTLNRANVARELKSTSGRARTSMANKVESLNQHARSKAEICKHLVNNDDKEAGTRLNG